MFLNIDREQACRRWASAWATSSTALQTTLGGYYINDFNLFGRTWQVKVQAEQEDRDSINDIYRDATCAT